MERKRSKGVEAVRLVANGMVLTGALVLALAGLGVSNAGATQAHPANDKSCHGKHDHSSSYADPASGAQPRWDTGCGGSGYTTTTGGYTTTTQCSTTTRASTTTETSTTSGSTSTTAETSTTSGSTSTTGETSTTGGSTSTTGETSTTGGSTSTTGGGSTTTGAGGSTTTLVSQGVGSPTSTVKVEGVTVKAQASAANESGNLPFTGSSTTALVGIGLVLVSSGLALVTRRRRLSA